MSRFPGFFIISFSAPQLTLWALRRFGSYDPELASFLPTASLGTYLNAGAPVDGECTTGFDNVGFV